MKKSNKKFKQYEKIIRKDEDFDFGYLLELERFKLKRMVYSFETASVPHVGIEYTIRDLKICVNLLDIIFEDDAPSKMYNDEYMKRNFIVVSPTEGSRTSAISFNEEKIPKFPIHVNTRNAKRFWKSWDDTTMWSIHLQDLRRVKALHLYNKIRNRCFGWWW